MKLSALIGLSFKNNINYSEVRRRIQKGEPLGSYDSQNLVTVPEDVFIMHIDGTENNPSYSQSEIESTQINTGSITEKLNHTGGKLGYLWHKVNQKCPKTVKGAKALLAYFGIDKLLDVGHTINDKTGELSQTINDKIGSAFDTLNDKIKDFSFKKLDNIAGDIADKYNDNDGKDITDTDRIADASDSTDLSDNPNDKTIIHHESTNTSDELHSNDDDVADGADDDVDVADDGCVDV